MRNLADIYLKTEHLLQIITNHSEYRGAKEAAKRRAVAKGRESLAQMD
jgi:hypothetical protein